MGRPGTARERSIVAFLVAVLALNPPFLTIFSVDVFVLGVPLLYLYLFAVWAVIVAVVARLARDGAAAADEGPSRGRRRSGHAR